VGVSVGVVACVCASRRQFKGKLQLLPAVLEQELKVPGRRGGECHPKVLSKRIFVLARSLATLGRQAHWFFWSF